jgi:hypothetical protein
MRFVFRDPATPSSVASSPLILFCWSRAARYHSGDAWFVADISAVRSVFAAEHDRIRGRFERWIREGQAEGHIRPDLDANAAALMVGSQLLGFAIQVLIDPAMDLDPIRATYLATLRQAFSPSAMMVGRALYPRRDEAARAVPIFKT